MEQQKELYWNKNNVKLVGKIEKELEYDNRVQRINFYTTKIAVPRKSGVVDHLPLMISEKLLKENGDLKGKSVCIYGQFRSYDRQDTVEDERQENERKEDERDSHENKVKLYVFVNKIRLCKYPEVDNDNTITIDGYLCKKPVRRKTNKGIEITQLLIAVNRKNESSDYIPCIAWDILAQRASELKIGMHIIFEGRLQSRRYPKKFKDKDGKIVKEWRETYEMSITKLHEDRKKNN